MNAAIMAAKTPAVTKIANSLNISLFACSNSLSFIDLASKIMLPSTRKIGGIIMLQEGAAKWNEDGKLAMLGVAVLPPEQMNSGCSGLIQRWQG